MSIGVRDRAISLVVAIGILGVLVVLATGESSTPEQAAATRAELWDRALADLKAAGNGTYRVEEVHEACDAVPVGTPCEGVARTITQTGTYFLEPAQISWHHELVYAGTSAVTAGHIETADGERFWTMSSPDEPNPCWLLLRDEDQLPVPVGYQEAEGTAAVLPWSVQALFRAEVVDRSRPPRLPADLRAEAPARLVIGFVNPLVFFAIGGDFDGRLPVRIRLDENGQVVGLSVIGSELGPALDELVRSGAIQVDDGGTRALASLLNGRFDLTVQNLGHAVEVQRPDPQLISDASRPCAAAR